MPLTSREAQITKQAHQFSNFTVIRMASNHPWQSRKGQATHMPDCNGTGAKLDWLPASFC